MHMKRHIEVVGAIFIDDQKNVFCTRRTGTREMALKWEFPGGKIEPFETPQEALKREIMEELESDITVLDHFLTVNHEYDTFTITFQSFMCDGLSTNYVLNDHEEARWVHITDLLSLDWAEADIPIVNKLMKMLKNSSI